MLTHNTPVVHPFFRFNLLHNKSANLYCQCIIKFTFNRFTIGICPPFSSCEFLPDKILTYFSKSVGICVVFFICICCFFIFCKLLLKEYIFIKSSSNLLHLLVDLVFTKWFHSPSLSQLSP